VSRTYRTVIVALVAILAVGGYWKLALAPKRQEAADLDQQVIAAQAQLGQTRATIATYQHAKDAYKVNRATVVRLGKAVPEDDDTRSLVVQLDTAAKRSGIDFDNVDISASAGAATPTSAAAAAAATAVTPGAVNLGSFSAMPFNFSFTGRFGDLSNFISRLEQFVTVDGDKINVRGRLLRVDGLALHPAENGWPGLQVDIAASSYLVPEAATPSAVAASTDTPSTTTAATTTSNGSDLR
jgi:Tfp pilus assembly protein PilO